MKQTWTAPMLYLDVVLAIIVGAFIFAFLDMVSGGLLITVLTVAGGIVVIGLVNYFVWGKREVSSLGMQVPAQVPAAVPEDEFVLNITERERIELLRLLTQSLKQGQPTLPEQATIDQQLADKLHMFGA